MATLTCDKQDTSYTMKFTTLFIGIYILSASLSLKCMRMEDCSASEWQEFQQTLFAIGRPCSSHSDCPEACYTARETPTCGPWLF